MNIGYFKYDVPENSRYSPFYAISFEFTIWKVREFNDIKQWKGKRDKKFHNDWKLLEFQGIVRNMENITYFRDMIFLTVFPNFLLPSSK